MTAIVIQSNTEFSERKILGKTALEHLVIRLKKSFDKVIIIENASDIEQIKHKSSNILVISGDMPLINFSDVESLLKFHTENDNDISYIQNIIGGGVCFFKSSPLFEIASAGGISNIGNLIFNALKKGLKSGALIGDNKENFTRVNNIEGFHKVSEKLRIYANFAFEAQGVRFFDLSRCYIDIGVEIGEETIIYPDVIIEGKTIIGRNCVIGPGCHLKNMIIGNGTRMSNTVAYDSEIGNNTETGPFAYIRPGSKIGSNCKVGDFVEVKNSIMGDGAKASHLTYIGDADIGKNVNLGCGTVVVNYDGKNKHRTVVEDDCFIGCNTNLISPVTVKKGAFIAAGSTITEDVPEETLAIARARQVNRVGWKRP